MLVWGFISALIKAMIQTLYTDTDDVIILLLVSYIYTHTQLYDQRSLVARQITQTPHNMAAMIGDSIQLNCSVQGYSDKMEWTINGDNTIYYNKNPDYNLVIEEVDRDMAGPYQCSFPAVNLKASAELVALCK